MVNPDQYIKEGLKLVQKLMNEGSLPAALKACEELVRVNPYNKNVTKYIKNIEEAILRDNLKKVDHDIDSTLHLWEEKRYDDLMKIYTKLYQFAPQHGRLKSLIEKLMKAMGSAEKDSRREYIERATKAIVQLLAESRFGDAMQACNELLTIDPLNVDAQRQLVRAQDGLIETKLTQNAHISESANFERMLEFYESLAAINPANKKVKSLILQTKSQLAEQRVLAAKIALNESVARMKELFNASEYEKVIQACEEIDRLDPGNFAARMFHKKAQATMNAESDILESKQLKEQFAVLSEEYTKLPDAFVRI